MAGNTIGSLAFIEPWANKADPSGESKLRGRPLLLQSLRALLSLVVE
jgi:hypothetical protein